MPCNASNLTRFQCLPPNHHLVVRTEHDQLHVLD